MNYDVDDDDDDHDDGGSGADDKILIIIIIIVVDYFLYLKCRSYHMAFPHNLQPLNSHLESSRGTILDVLLFF